MAVSDSKDQQIDARMLRDAFGSYPTGVVVLSGFDSDGKLFGVTMNSFSSVSLDPPLVSCCVAKSLTDFDRFMTSKTFALNVLREDQDKLSTQFATSNIDRWEGVDYRRGIHDMPVIVPNLAVFQCVKHAEYDCGDHVIVIGRVEAVEHDDQGAPLVFHRGRYRQLS